MIKEKKENIFLPISLNITDKKILIVGGGKVAAHKMNLLSRFSMNLTILSPKICDAIATEKFKVIVKKYEAADLADYFLVYACTDNQELNKQIKSDANQRGTLVNVADNPALCDFVSPAIYKQEELTVAVGSNAQNVKKSIAVRNKISIYLKSTSGEENAPELSKKETFGKVTLVGFGPGDPEL